MKHWVLVSVAVSLLGLVALEASAQEPVVGPTARSGVLRRVQERRGRTIVVTPTSGTSTSTMKVMPAPSVTTGEPLPQVTPAPAATNPTTPVPATTAQIVETRGGLFARLRGRAGR